MERYTVIKTVKQTFFCDIMLGRLAKHLRMLGIDTKYSRSISESTLIKMSSDENRTILTRRTSFLKLKEPVPFCFVNSNNPKIQLTEIIKYFNVLPDSLEPFSLCLLCNSALGEVDRNLVEGKVPDYIFNTIEKFSQCPACNRIYWQGTHYKNMTKRVLYSLYGKS